MTTNKCLYSKVVETNLVQGNSENPECSKRQNFKMCKMSMGGNDTHKIKLVEISKLKQNAKK